tara:strand:+ start:143 stop:1516 length:1374 start_codon:yes stop_codon:yes gene_type:complete
MANELDKTIEELEAEVLAELEEANGADAPKKGAMKAEPMDKKPEGEVQDTGKAVVDGDQGDAPVKKVIAKAKEVSGDPAQKGEGKPDAQPKLKEEDEKKDEKSEMKMDDKEKKEDSSDKEEAKEEVVDIEEMQGQMMKAMKSMKKDEMSELYASYMKASMNKTKDEMFKEMSDGMKKLNAMKMKEMMGKMSKKSEEQNIEKDAKTEERLKSVDVKEHVDALLNSDSNLSEDFKSKAATIFETAVKSKIRSEIKRLEDEYASELIEAQTENRNSLTEKVDNYLNYVVEEWMKENELALERGLKGEIAEDFISGLKTLFEDHYIDVPNEKYNVLEDQADKISKLEKKLEETIQQVVEAKEANSSLIKEKVMNDVSSDLTDTEIEKFQTLSQDVEYSNEEGYAEKLNTIKESYFPRQKAETKNIDNEQVETGTAVQDITEGSPMAKYINAIGKTAVNNGN